MTAFRRRDYADQSDYCRMRRFLRDVYLRNERRQLSWPLYRWDYWRHPDHQRRGPGKAVMAEGLRRLAYPGAVEALVSSYGDAAHALYASMGFTEYHLNEPWLKTW